MFVYDCFFFLQTGLLWRPILHDFSLPSHFPPFLARARAKADYEAAEAARLQAERDAWEAAEAARLRAEKEAWEAAEAKRKKEEEEAAGMLKHFEHIE